jgi:hypothetical protein
VYGKWDDLFLTEWSGYKIEFLYFKYLNYIFKDNIQLFYLAGIFLRSISATLLYIFIYRSTKNKMLGIVSAFLFMFLYGGSESIFWIRSHSTNAFIILFILFLILWQKAQSKTQFLLLFFLGVIQVYLFSSRMMGIIFLIPVDFYTFYKKKITLSNLITRITILVLIFLIPSFLPGAVTTDILHFKTRMMRLWFFEALQNQGFTALIKPMYTMGYLIIPEQASRGFLQFLYSNLDYLNILIINRSIMLIEYFLYLIVLFQISKKFAYRVISILFFVFLSTTTYLVFLRLGRTNVLNNFTLNIALFNFVASVYLVITILFFLKNNYTIKYLFILSLCIILGFFLPNWANDIRQSISETSRYISFSTVGIVIAFSSLILLLSLSGLKKTYILFITGVIVSVNVYSMALHLNKLYPYRNRNTVQRIWNQMNLIFPDIKKELEKNSIIIILDNTGDWMMRNEVLWMGAPWQYADFMDLSDRKQFPTIKGTIEESVTHICNDKKTPYKVFNLIIDANGEIEENSKEVAHEVYQDAYQKCQYSYKF